MQRKKERKKKAWLEKVLSSCITIRPTPTKTATLKSKMIGKVFINIDRLGKYNKY